MSESIQSATQGETAPAVESVPQPATDTAPDTGQEQQAEPAEHVEAEEKPKHPHWKDRRIDELTRNWREEQRQAEQLRNYVRSIQHGDQAASQQQGQPPAGYVPASEVGRMAAQQNADHRFNEACNAIADHGETKFRDFQTAVHNFQMLGGPPPALLEAVTALGKEDGARVFYQLGMNPDEAQRLAGMSPARMAVEVTRMASKPSAAAPVSRLPEPITPISAARTEPGGEPDAKRNPTEWASWFRKQYQPR